MKRAYLDSSFLVSIAFSEAGAARLREKLLSFDQVVSSGLLEAEVRSVFARENLDPDLAGAHLRPIVFFEPPRRLASEIGRVLAAGYLRGADLWHLACALYISPDPKALSFLTLDRDQKRLARKLGFR